VVVGNHSGSIPIDGLMLRTAFRTDHPASRDLRWLAEDFLFYLPFAGVFMNRAGAVRACQENAERLLARDNLIAVFSGGRARHPQAVPRSLPPATLRSRRLHPTLPAHTRAAHSLRHHRR